MEQNDENGKPRRRSLIPDASTQIPVTSAAADGEADSAPTEVFAAIDAADHLAPAPAHGEPVPVPPWFRRTWVIATAAGVVVLGVVIGVIVALAAGGNSAAAPTMSPTATDMPPSPPASAEPGAPTLLDDGIAADEYPDAAPSAGDDYPQALVMKDWVWDRVGPTWTLVSATNFDAATQKAGPSVIYLASPEGVLFDLVHVNTPGGMAQVVSWLPSERKARIQVTSLGSDSTSGGALLDLQTGAVDEMSFGMDSGRSVSEYFLAASANGAEVWSARDASYQWVRFQSWSRSGGWKRVLADADVSPWTMVASKNGAVVAGEIYSTDDSGFASARSGPPGQPVLVLFNVDTGKQTIVRPDYGSSGSLWCNLYAVSDLGEPILACWDESFNSQTSRMATDGKPLSTPRADAVQLPMDFWKSTALDLPAVGISLVSAPNDMQVYEVTVGSEGSDTVVLKAGAGIPYGGLSKFSAARVAKGVTLVGATEACALIDTENAHGVVLATTKSGIIGCVAYGVGNGVPPNYLYTGEGG